MPTLNWGLINDGGTFESLMHAILYVLDPDTILFGRLGTDAGQDARSADGTVVYQAKYRQNLTMDGAILLALEELEKIKKYRSPKHDNNVHWRNAQRWVLVANFLANSNDEMKWKERVVPSFRQDGLEAEYWGIERLEQKLHHHPEIEDVFFGGQNRVLVGLKEAHDLLIADCIGSMSLEVPMVDRKQELEKIKEFTHSEEKRILPIIGPSGIGKSRLLYESLNSLAQNEWRVLWALPETMASSNQWFRLLSGRQKTCVAIDDPDDLGLLRKITEQLVAVERQNWRVILTYRLEREKDLKRFLTNKLFHDPLKLSPLDEPSSKILMNSCLAGASSVDESWLHSVYSFTHGIPGWLCLIAELAKRKKSLIEVLITTERIANAYIDSCLATIEVSKQEAGQILLRWLSLWGTIQIDGDGGEEMKLHFLEEKQGILAQTVRELLIKFAEAGLIRNWGVGKRLFAIEPQILRQQILGSWLLQECDGKYEVNTTGKDLITQLVKWEIPAVDSILSTLSQLAVARLEEPQTVRLLKPVLDCMEKIVREGDIQEQYAVAGLVEKLGVADPEGALEILKTILERPKEDKTVEIPIWGSRTFSHSALADELPWKLFQIGERVSDQNLAKRYINEFKELVLLENNGGLRPELGKAPSQLLKRLLCESKNQNVYERPAFDLAVSELENPSDCSFVQLLAECLLKPVRESTEWVANWTIAFSKRMIVPNTNAWLLAETLRKKIFEVLKLKSNSAIRNSLWQILAVSHKEYHRALKELGAHRALFKAYREILENDLALSKQILSSQETLSLEEVTFARKIWSWYLEFGSDEDPALVGLAHECEDIYNRLSKWRFQDFFQFEAKQKSSFGTERIIDFFRKASKEEIDEFFKEAQKYLKAAGQGNQEYRISELASALCVDIPDIAHTKTDNALMAFVRDVLTQKEADKENRLAWVFAVSLCRKCLYDQKKSTDESCLAPYLSNLLDMVKPKPRFLYELYSNAHQLTVGTLTTSELSLIMQYENELLDHEWPLLFGIFCAVGVKEILNCFGRRLDFVRNDTIKASHFMASFIRSLHVTAIRYELTPDKLPIEWIIGKITELDLDGSILGMYDLEGLRDQASFHLSMVQFTSLMSSRIALEKKQPGGPLEIMPHDFKTSDWVIFNASDQAEANAFHEFCSLALGPSFLALYWMPKYVAQIDPSGESVAEFVRRYTFEHPDLNSVKLSRLGYLAATYPEDSTAWENIAIPICKVAEKMKRSDREVVYFGLSTKETEVTTSTPGEIPKYYSKVLQTALDLLANESPDSPLFGYREWSVERAKEDLHWQEGLAEEDNNA